ncbi:MAG: hypothetical protein JXC36_04025, partial [Candidatus Atribacteria bacterium]|nr:hypothetical protein [Candidatus Atribacteria bacterium]
SLKAGFDENDLLKQLKSKGISSIAIQEDTIETLALQGKLVYLNTNDLTKLRWLHGVSFPGLESVSKAKFLLVFRDHSIFQRVKIFFQSYFGKDQIQESIANHQSYLLLSQGNEEDLLQIGLGFSNEDIQKVEELGFHLILRPKNTYEITDEVIRSKLLAISQIKSPSAIIFDDEEVLGYPSKEMLSLTARFLNEGNLPFGIIEFTSQDGIQLIAAEASKLAVRVHSITKDEMENISVNIAVDRWIRAAQERNVRIFYLNPFLDIREENVIQKNLTYVENIKDRLMLCDFQLSAASLFPQYEVPKAYLYFLGLGILAAGIILAGRIFKMDDRQNMALFLASLVLLFFLSLFFSKIFLMKILALAGALIFPALAMIGNKGYFLTHVESKTIPADSNKGYSYIQLLKKDIIGITGVMIISSIGGLLIGALLTHYQFMLAVRQFSGIKIAYVFPLIVVAFYLWWNSKEKKYLLIEDFKQPILLEHVFLLFILLIFVIIYISRSGNFSFLPVPDIEEKMRILLEKTLIARPRTKEFLIGYPLLSLAIAMNFLGIHYLKHPIIVMGTVAPVTIVNTFCHVHTPISLSLLRTFHGYWLGLIIGILLISVIFLLKKFFKAWFYEKRSY